MRMLRCFFQNAVGVTSPPPATPEVNEGLSLNSINFYIGVSTHLFNHRFMCW